MKIQIDKDKLKIWGLRIIITVVILLLLMFPEVDFSHDKKPKKNVSFIETSNPSYPAFSVSFIKRWGLHDKERQINERCESYRSQVEDIAAKYDMSEYVDLILAVMMQESSGQGTDIMQASEGEHNKAYPRVPNGITDITYSITCGIQDLKQVLEKAGVTGPNDLQNIEQALQGYNFGYAYLDFARERGDYLWEEETVAAFAEKSSGGKTRDAATSKQMGKWQFGDQFYPQHVLRYYPPYTKLFANEKNSEK